MVTVKATFGRTNYEVEDNYGISVSSYIVDFLILASAMDAFIEPEMGDQITVSGRVYEVMAITGQGHWQWSDQHRVTMRIHTKEIGAE